MNIKLVRESVLNSIEPIARKIGFDRSGNKFFLINKDVLYQEIVISVSKMGSSYVVEPLLYVYWKEFSRNFYDFSEYMYDNGLSLEKPKKDCAILILQFRSIAENICMKNYESMFISGEAHPMDMHRTLPSSSSSLLPRPSSRPSPSRRGRSGSSSRGSIVRNSSTCLPTG